MPGTPGSSALKVTLVGPDPQELEWLARAVRSWQFDCQTAGEGEEALRLLEEAPTPVVVADLGLPGRKGIWLVREVRGRWPWVATFVITGDTGKDAAVECLNSGVQRFFLRPLRLPDLRQALRGVLLTDRLQRHQEQHRRELRQAVRRQARQSRATFLSAIDCLIRTLEARDPYTSGHSLRVRQYSLYLAVALGLDHRRRRQISLAGKLHDIGKVGVPEAVLNKPGPLTAEELRLMREHPVISERILAPIIRDPVTLAAVRGHHERYDGKGYPDGLAGVGIPLEARVIAVADCFDALTSARAYRAPVSAADALAVIRQEAGRQFDPEMAPVFVRSMGELLARQGTRPAAPAGAPPLAEGISLPLEGLFGNPDSASR